MVSLMPVSAWIQRELFKNGLNRDGKTDTLGVLDDQGVDPVHLTVLIDTFLFNRPSCQPVPEHVAVFYFIYPKIQKKNQGPLTLVFAL